MTVKDLIIRLLDEDLDMPVYWSDQDISDGNYNHYTVNIIPVQRFSDKKPLFLSLRCGDPV